MSLVIVGTVAFDDIITPHGHAQNVVGGAATYACIAASYFTKNINLVSVVGEDFPEAFLQKLSAKGVNQEGLQIKKGEKSFFWSGKYHSNMNVRDTLVTDLNVLADFDPILPESYKTPDLVMLGNLTPMVQSKVLEQLTATPKLVVLDTMNFWMDNTWDQLLEVIQNIDVLTINDEEARQLSGEYSLVKAANKIFTMGPKYLVIKKGEHGALLFHQDKIFFAPALPLTDVVDPTGAGDTFAGGFIGHLSILKDISFEGMKTALIYGSAMASFCVEQFGTEGLIDLTQDEIDRRVLQFQALSEFSI